MTRPARRKSDGRRRNGRQPTGDNERQILVSGPEALLVAVAERAAREHVSTREAWRRAARAWLREREVTE